MGGAGTFIEVLPGKLPVRPGRVPDQPDTGVSITEAGDGCASNMDDGTTACVADLDIEDVTFYR